MPHRCRWGKWPVLESMLLQSSQTREWLLHSECCLLTFVHHNSDARRATGFFPAQAHHFECTLAPPSKALTRAHTRTKCRLHKRVWCVLPRDLPCRCAICSMRNVLRISELTGLGLGVRTAARAPWDEDM